MGCLICQLRRGEANGRSPWLAKADVSVEANVSVANVKPRSGGRSHKADRPKNPVPMGCRQNAALSFVALLGIVA